MQNNEDMDQVFELMKKLTRLNEIKNILSKELGERIILKNVMPMNFLETEDVVKQYANHLALDKVSIQVPEGKVFGLLGPNGAGKTTPIRIINRITAPDSGLVRFNGREFQPEDIYGSVTCRKNAACIKKNESR